MAEEERTVLGLHGLGWGGRGAGLTADSLGRWGGAGGAAAAPGAVAVGPARCRPRHRNVF